MMSCPGVAALGVLSQVMTLPPVQSAQAATTSLFGSIVGDKCVYAVPLGYPLANYPTKHSPYFQAGFGLMVSNPAPPPVLRSHTLRAHSSTAEQHRAWASA